ncbi:MAG TPA: universal stress protein [Gaiellaceae bacterium]|nr:universal stress protein [Gaiellaceae bacterium]
MIEDGPLLICFDGSEEATAAVTAAAALFESREAVVACYWQPFGSTKRLGVDVLEFVQDPATINEREEQVAREIAEQGAALATAGGLSARAEAVATDSSVGEAILNHAQAIGAAAIVLGAQSRSRLRSLILGNAANETVQRAAFPVFVAPSPALADRRRAEMATGGPDEAN